MIQRKRPAQSTFGEAWQWMSYGDGDERMFTWFDCDAFILDVLPEGKKWRAELSALGRTLFVDTTLYNEVPTARRAALRLARLYLASLRGALDTGSRTLMNDAAPATPNPLSGDRRPPGPRRRRRGR